MATIHLTKEDFVKRVYDYKSHPGKFVFLGKRPAVVDFYATWCAPCRMLSPLLEELSEEYAGRIDVYKVNVEEQEELSAQFEVQSIPTMLFISVTGKLQRTVGAMGKPQLSEAFERLLRDR